LNKNLINTLFKSALEVEKRIGVPATFQVAQAILESGWDLKPIKDAKTGRNSFNIYGIKYHLGDKNFVSTITTEYENGLKKVIVANFQAYKDYEECFNDHAQLLTKEIGFPVTYNDALTQYKKDKNLDLYIVRVSRIYATDPEYANYIKGVIKLLPKTEEEVKEEPTEFSMAWDLMIRLGVFKPYGDLDTYKDKLINRRELAVLLARLVQHLEA
jgi:flagellum-specific peptidoglycan hydrolase FlgJ